GGYGGDVSEGGRADGRSAEKHVADQTENRCGGAVGGSHRGGRSGDGGSALQDTAGGESARPDRREGRQEGGRRGDGRRQEGRQARLIGHLGQEGRAAEDRVR